MSKGKPNFREFIEAQRKAKKDTESNKEATVEIFVSPTKNAAVPCSTPPTREIEMVTVVSACGHKFIVPKEAACISGFVFS